MKDEQFLFDAVFTPGTQDEVFEDCRDLVQSAADGRTLRTDVQILRKLSRPLVSLVRLQRDHVRVPSAYCLSYK